MTHSTDGVQGEATTGDALESKSISSLVRALIYGEGAHSISMFRTDPQDRVAYHYPLQRLNNAG